MRSALLFVLPLLVACGGGQPEAQTPAPEPAPSAQPAPVDAGSAKDTAAETPAPKLEATPPVVKLVDAGKAPKRALRYEFKKGAVEWLETDMKMSMTMVAGDQAAPKATLPSFRLGMKLEAKDVSDSGDASIAFEVVKVDVSKDGNFDPALRQKLEGELNSGIVGLHGSARITARGVNLETEIALPDSASPMAREQVENVRDAVRQVYSPLPEEEVGSGAKWDVTSRVLLGQTAADVVQHFTLDKLEATSAKLIIDTTMSGPPNQPLDLPQLPPGATAKLESLQAKSSGNTTSNFKKLVSSSDIKTNVVSVVAISKDAESMKMKTELDMAMKIGPGKAQPVAKKK